MIKPEDGWLQIKKEQALAFGKPVPSGFVVRQGSTAMREGSPNKKRDRPERDRLVEQGILVPDENPALFRFSVDHVFNSQSRAAGVVIDGNSNGSHWQPATMSLPTQVEARGLFTRPEVEEAMDAFDRYSKNGEESEIFRHFGDPRDYWVRSSRDRENRVYPSKPLVGFLLKKTELNGGWGQKADAAARLHNSGFIIVDQSDEPVQAPERYEHLISGANRIRLCALNYFIEPAREKRLKTVTIRAGDLASAMELKNTFPNICQTLGGEKLQQLAKVPPPTISEPNPSSSTTFTYQLGSKSEADTMDQASTTISASATNLILYGPPGTGKTFTTAAEAVRLCAEPVPQDRAELMAVYQRLVAAGRIEFVTFHQSMSYEDFVEGRQPMTGADGDGEAESAGFRLETVHGVFRRIAKRAETSRGRSSGHDMIRLEGRQVFKMSIGEANNPEDAHLFEEAIEGGYTLLGFDDIDWSDEKYASREAIFEACKNHRDDGGDIDARSGWVQMPFRFRNWVRQGDIVIVSKGNQQFRAIGEFVGDYEFKPRPEGGYAHRRAVRWLWVDRDGVPVSEIYSRGFMQQSIYLLYDSELNIPALERYMNSQRSDGGGEPDQFVLIIDEINRANISKVFGELITLLEADKRLNQPNAVRVRLPYSGDEFGVPSNLHILGTMNTADRSIALLDTALRRRFTFREMMPDESILKEAAEKCGIDLPRLLTTINERIEYLYDREHQIGHAYFTACRSRADVDEVMRHKVIPLLAEYFFGDWAKIAAVLGDLEPGKGSITGGFLKRAILNPPPGLEDGDAVARFRWQVRSIDEGFDYSKLVGT
ncbi:AAA family ATPase [uncultured Paracoccus sp.]|uniref:AAA family ATPase n=1 Tax=uncultured Paracoccus sp. TaxID=189685 RepID=UPI00262915EE|nr:AAA family ATPase [uncultured Paracoccus sp.]